MKLWRRDGNSSAQGFQNRRIAHFRLREVSGWISLFRYNFCSCTNFAANPERVNPEKDKEKNVATSVSVLFSNIKACINSRDLEKGKLVHADVVRSGKDSDLYVANNLINMYVKCGSLGDAQKVFDTMKYRDVISWNSLMVAYAENGEGELVLKLFLRMTTTAEGCSASARSFVAAIQACANMAAKEDGKQVVDGKIVKVKSLEMGMFIHSEALKSGCGWDIFLSTTLVDMYSKCGSLSEACAVFDRMPAHNVVCWTALMLGYNENGEEDLALELFSRIQPDGWAPNSRTFVAALKACIGLAMKEEAREIDGKFVKVESLRRGVEIHQQASKRGFDSEMFLASTLVDMYSKCGSTVDARNVFDKMPKHDLVSWTGMLLGYAENGEEELALQFFNLLPGDDFLPDSVACVAALRACVSLAMKEESKEVNGRFLKVAALEKGMDVHAQAGRSKCEVDTFVASSLIEMYAKCGVLEDAKRIFDRVIFRDVLLWNSLMMAYADNGEGQIALEVFVFLKPEGCSANSASFVAAVKACSSLATKEEGREVEGRIVKMEALEKGMIIHCKAAKCGYDSDLFVGNTLVDMYSKCGSLIDARSAFDRTAYWNVVSWNALMLGCAENGEAKLSVELFECMESYCESNAMSFVAAMKACGSLASGEESSTIVKVRSLETGMKIHSRAAKSGCELDLFVGNTLVDLYAKCGSMIDSRTVFDGMFLHNVVTWTALLLGYAENNEAELALEVFRRMQTEGCSADGLSFVAALKACGALADVAATKMIHAEICRRFEAMEMSPQSFHQQLVVTSLMDAYGKCGSSMRNAQLLFDGLRWRDRVAWTALLAGYSRQGDAEVALEIYGGMKREGWRANDVTMVCVLSACSHGGFVERGRREFEEMARKEGIEHGIEHYVCMVDMLGRANELEEALEVIRGMKKKKATVLVWKTLLAGCKMWENEVIGKVAFEAMMELEGKDPAAYVLMAAVYQTSAKGNKDVLI